MYVCMYVYIHIYIYVYMYTPFTSPLISNPLHHLMSSRRCRRTSDRLRAPIADINPSIYLPISVSIHKHT